MEPQQARPNQLVNKTQAIGAAALAGKNDQVRELAQSLARSGVSGMSPVSQANLGHLPVRPALVAKQNDNNSSGNARGIQQDRPLPSHGR